MAFRFLRRQQLLEAAHEGGLRDLLGAQVPDMDLVDTECQAWYLE